MDHTLPHVEPWERRPGEPNLWYARFERYRLAGSSRSLLGSVNADRQSRGAAKTRSTPQAWAKNANRWQWRERAEAWDECQRQQARLAHAEAVEEMNRRHLQEAKALQSKAIQRLKSLNSELLSPADLLRFCIESTKLERTALREPQNIEEQRLTGPSGGPVAFTLEDAVRADQELEESHYVPLQPRGIAPLPEGNSQVP
jgi:hypothetical protein